MERDSIPELRRVMLVEDEIDIQMVARLALEDVGGFEVEVCPSGQAALETGPHFRPQLILLDFMMPGLDGAGTMQAFRQIPALADVPVAFITARAQLDEVAEYRDLGAVDVIVKPFDPMRLADRVQEIWRSVHAAAGGARGGPRG
jgi:CheY-like chemotaxis protein